MFKFTVFLSIICFSLQGFSSIEFFEISSIEKLNDQTVTATIAMKSCSDYGLFLPSIDDIEKNSVTPINKDLKKSDITFWATSNKEPLFIKVSARIDSNGKVKYHKLTRPFPTVHQRRAPREKLNYDKHSFGVKDVICKSQF